MHSIMQSSESEEKDKIERATYFLNSRMKIMTNRRALAGKKLAKEIKNNRHRCGTTTKLAISRGMPINTFINRPHK